MKYSFELVQPSVKIVSFTQDPLETIEKSARVCYKTEDKIGPGTAEKLVKFLINKGHTAMIEFADVHFLIICCRGISHELVRHRISSLAQESTRYVNYLKRGIQIINMRKYIKDDIDYENWLDDIEGCCLGYNNMIEAGYSPQIARSILPNALKTELNMKMNLRSLLNFFTLRTSKAAHPQMQEIANMMLIEVKKVIPVVFDAFEVQD